MSMSSPISFRSTLMAAGLYQLDFGLEPAGRLGDRSSGHAGLSRLAAAGPGTFSPQTPSPDIAAPHDLALLHHKGN
jgi:hypothetical protein